eukprot:2997246-Amphidinium_carterae.1
MVVLHSLARKVSLGSFAFAPCCEGLFSILGGFVVFSVVWHLDSRWGEIDPGSVNHQIRKYPISLNMCRRFLVPMAVEQARRPKLWILSSLPPKRQLIVGDRELFARSSFLGPQGLVLGCKIGSYRPKFAVM